MEDRPKPIQTVNRVSPDATDTAGRPLLPTLPEDYQQRFKALTLKSDFSDTIFAHIANGGTLISLAETWGVRHSDIAGYISTTKEFKERYEFALLARDEWEKERCLQELRAIATVDIRQAYSEDGTLKPMRELSPEIAAAIQSVESEELFTTGQERELIGYTKKVKFWDKAKAIELFMKKHGLLVDRVRVQHTMRLEDLIGAANADIIDAQLLPPTSLPSIQEPTPVPGVLTREPPSA